jgi:peptide/nickel transport system substrate-binding protein
MRILVTLFGPNLLRRERQRVRRTVAAAVLVVVTAGTTAGCFADPAATDEFGERRLQIGMIFPPKRQMSPFTEDASIVTQLGAAETLVKIDRTGALAPALAQSWSTVGPSTVRLTLRAGVTFHDGTPLTAPAAADALTHATKAKPAPRALAPIQLTATAIDAMTLELHTARPDPVLLHRLATPQLVILAPKAYARDPATPDPVNAGTGPYRLVEVQGTSAATLHRFDAYWGGHPNLAGINVRFLPEGAAGAGALRAGEIDVVAAVPVAQASNLGDLRLIEIPLPRTVGLYLVGTAGRPFADPGLRAAARAAADPAAIVRSVYEGRVDAGAGLFGPASTWAAAGRVPAAASAAAAPKPASPSGTKITLATYPDRPELPEVASALAAALTVRGFTVETVVRQYAALEPDLLTGRFDAVLLSRSYLLDTGDPIAFFTSDFGCTGSYNLARFCDPGFDTRVTAAAGLTDRSARHAAALALEADLLNRAVFVPIAHERARLGCARGVVGLAEDPYERTLVTARTTLR